MMWILAAGLLAACGMASTVTTGVDSPPGRISAVFYDFEKTITTNDIIGHIIMACDTECDYESCKESCLKKGALVKKFKETADSGWTYILDAFGDADRVKRLKSHFAKLKEAGVKTYIVAMALYQFSADETANLIAAMLKNAGIPFERDDILTAADPGVEAGGPVMHDKKKKMVIMKRIELKLEPGQILIVEDDPIRVEQSIKDITGDTLFVQSRGYTPPTKRPDLAEPRPKPGMDAVDMAYIEARATTETKPDVESKGQSAVTVTRHIDWATGPKATPVTAVFYDFENTLLATNFGEQLIKELCEPACSNDSGGPCHCQKMELAQAFEKNFSPELVEEAFGGKERLEMIRNHFRFLKKRCTDIYIVSRSLYRISKQAWATFIQQVLHAAQLHEFIYSGNAIRTEEPRGDKWAVTTEPFMVSQEIVSNKAATPSGSIYATVNPQTVMESITNIERAGHDDIEIGAETMLTYRGGIDKAGVEYINSRAEGSCPMDPTPDNMWDFCDAIASESHDACAKDCTYAFGEQSLIELMPESLIIDICQKPEGKYINLCPTECGTPWALRKVCGMVAEKKKCLAKCDYIFTDKEFADMIPASLNFLICEQPEGAYTKLCPTECGDVDKKPKPFENYFDFAAVMRTTRDEATCKAFRGKFKSKTFTKKKCVPPKEKKMKCQKYSKNIDVCEQLLCTVKELPNGNQRCVGTVFGK